MEALKLCLHHEKNTKDFCALLSNPNCTPEMVNLLLENGYSAQTERNYCPIGSLLHNLETRNVDSVIEIMDLLKSNGAQISNVKFYILF